MEKTIFYVSDCCNAESNKDYEICSQCGEHCEILTDDSMVKALEDNNMTMEEYNELPDYIPSYDDGEWTLLWGMLRIMSKRMISGLTISVAKRISPEPYEIVRKLFAGH